MSTETEDLARAANIWYVAQRVLRTALATLITILPLVPQVLAIVNDAWSAEWLIAIGAQAVALNSVITRIMAIPVVNAWLIKIGFGSVPKSALAPSPHVGVYVKTDMKAEERV